MVYRGRIGSDREIGVTSIRIILICDGRYNPKNPETNVTHYEKPAASSHTGSAPPQKLSSAPVSSSVQVEQSSHGHCDSIFNDDDDRYNGGSNSGSKLDTGTRSYQSTSSAAIDVTQVAL
ncbi:hypothetical protein HYC85_021563 [Camellia sinensis]|uniref:Uncharacterized protein n=1 Tax=Camellia sinensis TaxID=4442 RepID=A0A7J7GLT9_CAMSI|nr:hypothetical protein HYC85_021563 [Camellia sinensis]